MDRKEIVKVLGEHFGVKPKYMKVPSCAYQIESAEGILTIDRVGKITNLEGVEFELEAILNANVEEKITEVKEQEENNTTNEVIAIEPQTTPCQIAIPMEGHTGISLRNLVNMIYSKQELIQKAIGIIKGIISEDFITGINKDKIESLEDFKTAIEGIGEKSCPGIEFDFEEQRITFKFIEGDADAEKIKAYSQFVGLLNQSAKTLKHASPKVNITDNDKFAFRTWLIRLGMIGDEYKSARKILLERLSGNSAFRNGRPEKVEIKSETISE